MSKKLSLLVILVLVLSALFVLPIGAGAESLNGFVEEDGDWYYYRDGVPVTNEVIEYGNYLYGFDDWGRMYEEESFEIYSEEEDTYFQYRAKKGGPLYENEWYRYEWDECWYYYGENGVAPHYEFVTVNGTTYYFEHAGRMFTDGAHWVDMGDFGAYYAFDKYGAYEQIDMTTTGWQQCKGNWYYVADEGDYTDLVGGELFTADNGQTYVFNDKYAMATDELVNIWTFDGDEWDSICYYANSYGMPYVGWIQPYINEANPDLSFRKNWWYYFDADGKALEGYHTVNGTDYYFDYEGQMLQNTYDFVYDEFGEVEYAWAANENGVASRTYGGWLRVYGNWRYFDGTSWADGLREIDGDYYYFAGQELVENQSYDEYRAKVGGRLYRNEWYKDENGDWYYYGADCRMASDVVMNIGGTYYAFDDWGCMLKDTIVSDDFGDAYIVNKDGVGTRVTGTGWYKVGKYWAYAEDGTLVYDYTWKTIDGKDYFFDGYYILTDTYLDGYVLAAGGQKITTPGWHFVDGEYYYVTDTDGNTAGYGWYKVNGRWYYFWPEMAHNTILEDNENGCVYGFDTNGGYFQITGDGFYTSWPGMKMYVENGKFVTNTWKRINGAWYYFSEYGEMATGPYYVDGECYLFSNDGKLIYNDWYYSYGDYYRSDASGKLLTGYQRLDGNYYLFSEDGWMQRGIAEYDGYTYLLHEDGRVYGYEFKPHTWYKVDGEWYYFDEYDFLRDEVKTIDGYEYAFYGSGCMVTDDSFSYWDENDDYHYGYYDKSGHKLVNTWCNTPHGYRYYDSEGDYYYWGFYTIGGVEYCFMEGYLKTGTFVYNGQIVSTTAGGAVISKTDMSDGWTYSDGHYYYVKNGDHYYTGWVGSYYVIDGQMVYHNIIDDNGNYYYINANGVYIRSGWQKLSYYGDTAYLYANANGTLKCNEWAKIGGTWYYFDNIYMAADGTYEIDGEEHEFAANGAWLGKKGTAAVNPNKTGYANGWVYLNGKYYYSFNGTFLQGNQYIDGAWYRFGYGYGEDEEQDLRFYQMLSDEFYNGLYYTKSGALYEGTGWHLINGKYVYFDGQSRLQTGLITVNGTKYYIAGKYINEYTENEKLIYYMLANEYLLYDGTLYYASAGGALSKVAKPNGWYWINTRDTYVYYKNGTMLSDGEYVINGTTYLFYGSGEMASDTWEGYTYYTASGAKATNGWYWCERAQGWVYVKNGKMYVNGLYYINGTAYYFSDGFWVK